MSNNVEIFTITVRTTSGVENTMNLQTGANLYKRIVEDLNNSELQFIEIGSIYQKNCIESIDIES